MLLNWRGQRRRCHNDLGCAVTWRGESLARPLTMETSSGGGPAALVAAGSPELRWQWPLEPLAGEASRGSLIVMGKCLACPWAEEANRRGTTLMARWPPRPSAVGAHPKGVP